MENMSGAREVQSPCARALFSFGVREYERKEPTTSSLGRILEGYKSSDPVVAGPYTLRSPLKEDEVCLINHTFLMGKKLTAEEGR